MPFHFVFHARGIFLGEEIFIREKERESARERERERERPIIVINSREQNAIDREDPLVR